VGIADAEQIGVRLELLAAPVSGPVCREVVQRRPPHAYMVDVEREAPDPVEADREASLLMLAALAAAGGPKEGEGVAGGPGKAVGEPAGGPKEGKGVAGGPGKAVGEPAGSPKEGEGVAGGPEKAANEPAGDPKGGGDGTSGPEEAVGEPPQVPTSGTKDAGEPVKAVGGPEQLSGKFGQKAEHPEHGRPPKIPRQFHLDTSCPVRKFGQKPEYPEHGLDNEWTS
jgi:hypothetical protein